MKRHSGAIALTLVLIISIILITGGVTVLFLGIDSAYSSARFNSLNLAELYSVNCLEESLYRINEDESYTGSLTTTRDGQSCEGVVTNGAGTTKTLTVTATSGESTYIVQYIIDTATDPLSVSKQ